MSTTYRLLCLLVFLFIIPSAKSQLKDIKLSDADIQTIKSKTVVFVLPAPEYKHFDDYAALLPKVWTMTPLKVIKYDELDTYTVDVEKYAFFIIGGSKTSVQMSQPGMVTNLQYYLTLALPKAGKKKVKLEDDLLCRVMLYPDAMGLSKFNSDKGLYTTAVFRNFSLPYMMVYLNFVQENLQNRINPTAIKGYRDKTLPKKLSKDTLYVPDSLLYGHGMFGRETLADKSVFETYPYKYKLVSGEELLNIVKNGDPSKPVYLLEYVISNTDKYVGVLEVRSGKVLYRTSNPMSTNFKAKDMEKILQQAE